MIEVEPIHRYSIPAQQVGELSKVHCNASGLVAGAKARNKPRL
jgi:hypothetical protein